MKLKFFSPAKAPPDEAARQAALDSTGALDRRGDPAFDALVREAAERFGTPIAAISLVDRDRQFFVAEVGLGASETPRAISFCAHAIHGEESFVVPNATEDERFAGNPLVTENPNIRFYAGHPIVTSDGHRLGSFCVIDKSPRGELTEAEKAQLEAFARDAGRIIERRDER